MIGNLLDNAIKYTAVGGEVSVTVDEDRGAGFNIEIADNGIGMKINHRSIKD